VVSSDLACYVHTSTGEMVLYVVYKLWQILLRYCAPLSLSDHIESNVTSPTCCMAVAFAWADSSVDDMPEYCILYDRYDQAEQDIARLSLFHMPGHKQQITTTTWTIAESHVGSARATVDCGVCVSMYRQTGVLAACVECCRPDCWTCATEPLQAMGQASC